VFFVFFFLFFFFHGCSKQASTLGRQAEAASLSQAWRVTRLCPAPRPPHLNMQQTMTRYPAIIIRMRDDGINYICHQILLTSLLKHKLRCVFLYPLLGNGTSTPLPPIYLQSCTFLHLSPRVRNGSSNSLYSCTMSMSNWDSRI
jgi:hypothetical protein